MFKKLFATLIILTLLFGIVLTSFAAAVFDVNLEKIKNSEQKFICKATLEDEFAEDSVLIVLNKEVSKELKSFTKNDFKLSNVKK